MEDRICHALTNGGDHIHYQPVQLFAADPSLCSMSNTNRILIIGILHTGRDYLCPSFVARLSPTLTIRNLRMSILTSYTATVKVARSWISFALISHRRGWALTLLAMYLLHNIKTMILICVRGQSQVKFRRASSPIDD